MDCIDSPVGVDMGTMNVLSDAQRKTLSNVVFAGGVVMSSLGTSLHVRSLSMYIAIWACVSAGCIAIGVALDSLSPRFRFIIFGGR